mgnify:CR=1 FL=1
MLISKYSFYEKTLWKSLSLSLSLSHIENRYELDKKYTSLQFINKLA